MEKDGISTKVPRLTWEDVVGQERIKNFFRWILYRPKEEEKIELAKDHAVLLLGPQGSGKDMLVQATAGEFADKGYQYFCLTVPKSGMLPEGFAERITLALEDGNCILVIRRPERLSDAEEFEDFLETAGEAPNRLMILATTEKLERMDGAVAGFFCLVYGQKPDKTERILFFQEGLPEEMQDLKRVLAEQTEGYGYAQLTSLLLLLLMRVNYCYAQGFIKDDDAGRLAEYARSMAAEYCLPRDAQQVLVTSGVNQSLSNNGNNAGGSDREAVKGSSEPSILRERDANGHYKFNLKPL